MPAIIIEAIGRLFDEKMNKHNQVLDDRFDKQMKIDTDQIPKTELEKFKNEYIIETDGKLEELTCTLTNNEILVGKLDRRIHELEEIVDESMNWRK